MKNNKEGSTSISISKDLKWKFIIAKAKYGYSTWEEFMKSILKILNKFKPELEEQSK